jgi:signal transduction histidine kinase
MAASIAHEINNPLAAVMNALYLARATPNLPAGAQEYLETADEELKRIAMVTRQALGFYRESAALAPVSLGTVLDSVVDLLAGKIKSKNATVLRDYDHSVQVIAVAGELRQVFSNIVANSLDALAVGGRILLRVSCSRNSHASQVRVSIGDNGQGIDPSSFPRIFEPFFTTKQTVGTGLGLWIGKQIVDKHQGRIQIRSRTHGPLRGTVVSVLLPMGEARAEAASRAACSS